MCLELHQTRTREPLLGVFWGRTCTQFSSTIVLPQVHNNCQYTGLNWCMVLTPYQVSKLTINGIYYIFLPICEHLECPQTVALAAYKYILYIVSYMRRLWVSTDSHNHNSYFIYVSIYMKYNNILLHPQLII